MVMGFKASLALGRVIKEGARAEPLYFRDMTNKLVHASSYEWDLSDPDNPKLVCLSSDPTRWTEAEINLIALAAIVGDCMSDDEPTS
jgi:hypothetical protein